MANFTYTPQVALPAEQETYATETFAADYFEQARLNTSSNGVPWSEMGADEQVALLQQATIIIDTLNFAGEPVSEDQRLSLPRKGMKDRSGKAVADNHIPIEVALACCETALWLSQADRISLTFARPSELTGVGKIGGYDQQAKKLMPSVAKSLLRRWRFPSTLTRG